MTNDLYPEGSNIDFYLEEDLEEDEEVKDEYGRMSDDDINNL